MQPRFASASCVSSFPPTTVFVTPRPCFTGIVGVSFGIPAGFSFW